MARIGLDDIYSFNKTHAPTNVRPTQFAEVGLLTEIQAHTELDRNVDKL